MSDRTTVKQIIEKYLESNGYDGLGCEYCSCSLPDIMPCTPDGGVEDCTAGHKIPCNPETCSADGDCDFHIGDKS